MYIGYYSEARNAPETTILEFTDKDLGRRFHALVYNLCGIADTGSAMAHYIRYILQGLEKTEDENHEYLLEEDYINMQAEMSNTKDESWKVYKREISWKLKGDFIPSGIKTIAFYYIDDSIE